MDKKHFTLKLIPSRPTFAQDMTKEESAIMKQHIAYWRDLDVDYELFIQQ